MANSSPAHEMPQHPAVFPLAGADAVPTRIISDRQRLKFPDHPNRLVIRLTPDGRLFRLSKRQFQLIFHKSQISSCKNFAALTCPVRAGYDKIAIYFEKGGRTMAERTYVAIDLNNAEK